MIFQGFRGFLGFFEGEEGASGVIFEGIFLRVWRGEGV